MSNEISIRELIALGRSHVRRAAIVAGTLAGLAGLTIYLAPRQYVSRTVVVANTGGAARSGVLALASQFGVVGPSEAGGLQLYRYFATSDRVLRAMVTERYPSREDSVDLLDFLEVDRGAPDGGTEQGITRLRRRVQVAIDEMNGLLGLGVSTGDPVLSHALLTRLLEEIAKADEARRRGAAGADRGFYEEQLEEARQQLDAAERASERFLDENRSVANSPALQRRLSRLEGEVSLRQQVLVGLHQLFSQSQLEERRNTSSLSIVDPPTVPVRGAPKGTVLKTGLLFILFFGASLAWAMFVRPARKEAQG